MVTLFSILQNIQIYGRNLATLGAGDVGKDSKVTARLTAASAAGRYVDLRVDSIMSMDIDGDFSTEEEQEEKDEDEGGAMAIAMARYHHGDAFKDLPMPLELYVQVGDQII